MKPATALVLLSLITDIAVVERTIRYRGESDRLRTGLTAQQRERMDLVLAGERHRLLVEVELLRRRARGDRRLHLAVNVDSGLLLLERGGVTLRSMKVAVGAERFTSGVGDSAIVVLPLGQRTLSRILGPRDEWEVPESVYRDRALPVPDERRLAGVLGQRAFVLNDGTVLYAAPDTGFLSDTLHAVQGSVRLDAADLRAITASLRPGMTVYLYR